MLAPLGPMPLLVIAAIVLAAGAAYCLGYENILHGRASWGPSLLWSAYGVLPWLALVEWSKRRSLSGGMVVAAFLATAAASIALELLNDALAGGHYAPVALMLMRRLPPMATSFLLLLLVRRQSGSPRSDEGASPPALSRADLTSMAPSIRWLRAADNYVELHLAGRVILHRLTITECERALAPLGFVRVHRSYLVNRAHILRLRPGKRPVVEMAGGGHVPVGRAFAANAPRR